LVLLGYVSVDLTCRPL